MSSSPAQPKVCVRCGEDCSKRPRTRDEQGRYTCKQCADAAAAKTPASKPVAAAAPKPSAADEDAYLLEPEPPRKAAKPIGACPSCAAAMAGDAVICTGCGYDRRKAGGKTAAPAKKKSGRKGVTCPNCGYNLDGLRTFKCPECGEAVTESAIKRQLRSRSDRAAVIKAYVAPSLLLFAGVGVAAAMVANGSSAFTIVPFLVIFAAQFVVAFIIYVTCATMWFGMAASLHLTALQLGGVLGFMEALRWSVNALNDYRGLHWWWYLLIMILTVLTMAKVMDMDWEDAAIVGTFIALAWIMLPLLIIMAGWV